MQRSFPLCVEGRRVTRTFGFLLIEHAVREDVDRVGVEAQGGILPSVADGVEVTLAGAVALRWGGRQ